MRTLTAGTLITHPVSAELAPTLLRALLDVRLWFVTGRLDVPMWLVGDHDEGRRLRCNLQCKVHTSRWRRCRAMGLAVHAQVDVGMEARQHSMWIDQRRWQDVYSRQPTHSAGADTMQI